MFKRIHVYDLDGVLVDTKHRYRNDATGSIDLAYWYANRTAKKIALDKILPLAKQYLADCMNPEIYTVICTARNYNVLDIEFIVGRLGAPDKLIMKPEGNHRSDDDAIYKLRELQRLFNLRQFRWLPRKLWEDSPRNIAALSHLFQNCYLIPSHINARN